jgi:hypothetical protein
MHNFQLVFAAVFVGHAFSPAAMWPLSGGGDAKMKILAYKCEQSWTDTQPWRLLNYSPKERLSFVQAAHEEARHGTE